MFQRPSLYSVSIIILNSTTMVLSSFSFKTLSSNKNFAVKSKITKQKSQRFADLIMSCTQETCPAFTFSEPWRTMRGGVGAGVEKQESPLDLGNSDDGPHSKLCSCLLDGFSPLLPVLLRLTVPCSPPLRVLDLSLLAATFIQAHITPWFSNRCRPAPRGRHQKLWEGVLMATLLAFAGQWQDLGMLNTLHYLERYKISCPEQKASVEKHCCKLSFLKGEGIAHFTSFSHLTNIY